MRQPNNKKGPEGMAKVNKDVVKRLMWLPEAAV